jgi:hypothetical protein
MARLEETAYTCLLQCAAPEVNRDKGAEDVDEADILVLVDSTVMTMKVLYEPQRLLSTTNSFVHSLLSVNVLLNCLVWLHHCSISGGLGCWMKMKICAQQ